MMMLEPAQDEEEEEEEEEEFMQNANNSMCLCFEKLSHDTIVLWHMRDFINNSQNNNYILDCQQS